MNFCTVRKRVLRYSVLESSFGDVQLDLTQHFIAYKVTQEQKTSQLLEGTKIIG
jgi:hypothetical protein